MSFETITIVRQFPIIDGFVRLPDNLEKNRTSISVQRLVTTFPSLLSSINRMGVTGGARTAGKHGVQEWAEVRSTADGSRYWVTSTGEWQTFDSTEWANFTASNWRNF